MQAAISLVVTRTHACRICTWWELWYAVFTLKEAYIDPFPDGHFSLITLGPKPEEPPEDPHQQQDDSPSS